jgi:hypothetical protein
LCDLEMKSCDTSTTKEMKVMQKWYLTQSILIVSVSKSISINFFSRHVYQSVGPYRINSASFIARNAIMIPSSLSFEEEAVWINEAQHHLIEDDLL